MQNYRVLITPEQVDDLEQALRKLQKVITVEETAIARVIKESSRSAKFIPLKVKEDLTWEEVARIEVNLPDLPGLEIDRGEVRSYPFRDTTAHIVGYVRSVSQKDLEADDDPALRLPGFKIGKSGIERVHEQRLRGKAGASEVEVNVVGREVRELKRQEADSGERITLTIDGELQRLTQDVLSEHKSASAIIMDAETGAVYASASQPSFDPDLFVRGLSQEQWQIIQDDPGRPQSNKVIEGQYPPGSTFKMITALAALEAGVINDKTTVFCPGHYEFGNGRFHCWKKTGHGRVDVYSALAESCDVYFYKIATEVGIDRIAEMARRFGLGAELGFELVGEKPGLIPDREWKRSQFKSKAQQKWQQGETIVASIGQGYILTTPLQLAVMTARLVNGGYAVEPWVTGYIGDEFVGRIDEQWEKMNIPDSHLKMVKTGMERVVNGSRGTARAHKLDGVDAQMGGKTGTAQVRRITKEQRRLGVKNEELPWEQRHHALFVGYAPLDKPRYVCSVVVEHGVSGSGAAAPVAKALMEHALRRDPARTAMQPETIEKDNVLRSWPPKKPQNIGAKPTAEEG